MNIFYLDPDPVVCAQNHYDSHVIKMPLESAQMLSTTMRLVHSQRFCDEHGVYKLTFKNHPSTQWVRSHRSAFEYTYKLFEALLNEYKHRYGRTHASSFLLKACQEFLKESTWNTVTEFSPPPCAMPSMYKRDSNNQPFRYNPKAANVLQKPDSLLSYREYYKSGKATLRKYTNRTEPEWLREARRGETLMQGMGDFYESTTFN